MSKNLTRKGLALGAVVALGSSLFAGSPAFAIDPVSLAPTTGTTYTTILGETFSLSSQFTDAAQASNESLKWEITDLGDKLDLTAVNGAAATRSSTTHKIVVTGANTYAPQALTFKAAATTDAFDVTVQAWMDYDADSVIDSGEAASTVQTVKFIKLAKAGLTTTLVSPVIGDASAKATISFNSDVNVAQLTAGNYKVAFGKLNAGTAESAASGSDFASGVASNGTATTYDATDKVLNANVVLNSAVANAAAIYSAVAVVASAEVGSASYKSVAASVATEVAVFKSTVGDNISGSGAAYAVRSKVTTFTATSAVTKADGDDADALRDAVAGVAGVVTATYTPASADTTTTVTVGGKTLSNTTRSVTFDAVSGADGKFSATVVSSTGKVGSAVSLSVKVAGINATLATAYTWTDATVTGLTDLIAGGSNAVRSVVKGGSVSIDYILVDSYGALVTTEGYRVAVSAPGAGADRVAANKFVSFVGGKATVTFTDGSTAAGEYTVVADAQLASATTGNYGASVVTRNSAVKVLATAVAASAVTANAAATASLETEAFISGDKRVQANAYTDPGYTAGVVISGDVTDALGAPVYGATVTIAAAGILFTDGNIYSTGSITVNASASGAYSVTAFGTKSGKVTFTVTSGAATKTAAVTFAAGIRANLKTTTVVAPATSQTGRAVSVTATLVDTFGNAVSGVVVSFTSTGVGSLSAASATTDANGVASVKLVSQLGEDGDAVVTVTHGGIDGATTTTDDFTLAKTITFGITDAQIDIVGKRVTAVASYTKGKTVSFYVDGIKKWSKLSASDADVVLNYNLKKGTHTITVKISGGFTATEKFIVK